MRKTIFLAGTAVAFAAMVLLAAGGVLVLQPPLISPEKAGALRAFGTVVLAIGACAALLTCKREWIEALRPRRR